MFAASTQSRRVFYTGHVQGVGFRYTALHIAQGHSVTGFVRNLSDGRVELVAEGNPAEVERFLAEIAGNMSDHIQQAEVHTIPATGKYAAFAITH